MDSSPVFPRIRSKKIQPEPDLFLVPAVFLMILRLIKPQVLFARQQERSHIQLLRKKHPGNLHDLINNMLVRLAFFQAKHTA